MDGLLVIDKPTGPTSHDVVARMRRVLGERRIGHTGTLDPNASGVLPLVVGRATRLARFLDGDKAVDFAGVEVIVDDMSVPYLDGATIDFKDTISEQGFTIDNPNAAGSCACGDSFH